MPVILSRKKNLNFLAYTKKRKKVKNLTSLRDLLKVMLTYVICKQ